MRTRRAVSVMRTPLEVDLDALVSAARALPADEAGARIAEAEEIRRIALAPFVRALIGRVGVGKTTLLNAMLGIGRPTGLGGVTRAVETLARGASDAAGPELWVDTPGIDDPSEAIERLLPVLEAADRAIWVAQRKCNRLSSEEVQSYLEGRRLESRTRAVTASPVLSALASACRPSPGPPRFRTGGLLA